jgi:hypothetical protein
MRAVIFDVDGTVADPSHRVHFLDGPEKDWKSFHAAAQDDPVIEGVAAIARLMYQAAERGIGVDAVLIVTARHDDPAIKQTLIDWLEVAGIPYHRLYMRRDADTRPDHVVKTEILQRILDDGYQPICVFDDRPEVVRMWRDHGITTMQVAPDEQPATQYAGQTLFHMLVGPCSAGKSTYVAKNYKPEDVVSVDALRMQLYGDLGHSPEALIRVWKYAHGLIRARLEAGVFTVLDATNLDPDDRERILRLVPRNIFINYIVIDRDIDDKIRDRGWRTEEMVKKQDKLFRKHKDGIFAGDGHPWVVVKDKRTR